MTYSDNILVDQPVTYWRLNDSSGTTAADVSGNGHDGTFVNAPALGERGPTHDGDGSAVGFDAASEQRIEVPDHTDLRLGGASPATWEAWIQKASPASDSNRWFIGKGRPRVSLLNYLLEAQGNAGIQQLATRVDNEWHDTDSDALGAFDGWQHLVVTWNGADLIRFYRNSAPAGTGAFSPSNFPDSTGEPLMLAAAHASGLNDNVFHFDGRLSEVALFDTQLSAARIAAHYRAAFWAEDPLMFGTEF